MSMTTTSSRSPRAATRTASSPSMPTWMRSTAPASWTTGPGLEGNLGTFDGGCVDNSFRWCDNIDNVDPANLTLVSKAFANTVARMAFDTKIMSASNDYVTKTKPTLKGGTSRAHPAK